MLKADVLAKLEEYKDRPIEIGVADEGHVMYSGIAGHWVFISGENVVEIKKTTNIGTYGVAGINQQENPFVVTTAPFEMISYIRGFIEHKPGAIEEALRNLEPAGTSKSLDEIKAEIQSDSILKAGSPRGNLNTSNVEPGSSYGAFKGSAISTEIGGIPKYMHNVLTPENVE